MAPRTLAAPDIELLAPIGSGGQATVYRGKLWSGGATKLVAVKLYGNSDAASWSYRAEREILWKADHPSIPKLLGFFDTTSESALIIELLSGISLARLIGSAHRNGALFSGGVIAYIACELLSALSYLHGGLDGKLSSVIHGDIAPDNIFLTDDGKVFLLDFGAVYSPHKKAQQLFGKRAYLAPEQLDGEAASIWSDLYSLGAVMFETAILRPFDFPQFAQEFALLRKCHVGLPETLFLSIRACLAPTASLRPKNASLLLKILRSGAFAAQEDEKQELARIVKVHLSTLTPGLAREF